MLKVMLFNINDASPAGETFCEPALGLGYLKSYFDKYSDLNKKIEIQVLKYRIWNSLVAQNPDVIGISSVTQDYTNAVKYAQRIRNAGSKAILIIGGLHITNLPESFNDVFDIAVLGEAEKTFKELLEIIYMYGLNKEKLRILRGLSYKENQELVNTGRRALIDNLDIIPSPYRSYLKERTFLHILTARGCPFKCAYCSSSTFWGYQVRFHSAQRVVDEMRELIVNYRLKHISIWDDLFSINKKRLQEIIGLMHADKSIFRNITFGVTARPNVIDDEICTLLKEMNVTRISLGIESGSERMLKLLNRGLTCEQNFSAVKLLHKYGFLVNGGFIIGSPGETLQDMNDTYQFVLNSGLDGGGIGIAMPYPNTLFWDEALKLKMVSEDMDFSRFVFINDPTKLSANDNFMLLSENIGKKEFLAVALKIHAFFSRKNILVLFNFKTMNMRNLMLVLRDPMRFIPFIFSTLKRFITIGFRNVR